MAWITGSFLVDFLFALLSISYFIYWFLTNNDDYWEKRGVPHVKKGFLMDSILGKKAQIHVIQDIYNQFKDERFAGMFHVKKPVLMIRDPDLINRILVKDFSTFQDRGMGRSKNDPITTSLFSFEGHIWRTMRYKLTPTFSAGKLKVMYDQLSKCGDNMMEKIEGLTRENAETECKEFLSEFTLDVIASVAFGLEFKLNSPEYKKFKSTVNGMHANQSALHFVKLVVMTLFPKLNALLGLRPFPKEFGDYFINLTRSTLKYRKENNVHRNDYFQLLMTLKEKEERGDNLGIAMDPSEEDSVVKQVNFSDNDMNPGKVKLFTEAALCGNTFVFLAAGTDSTSSIISLILFELCQHQDVQRRLQAEVDAVLKNYSTWTYDAIKDMTYLDQVVQEGQRLYPNLTHLQRVCLQPYKIPDSDVVIEKGVLIYVPHYALQRDPQHHPDPELFKPERFEGNNFKPSPTFLPFGDGPRMCIAMRFAVMEVKTCVARIMSQYSVKLSPKTKVPLQLNRRSVTPTVDGGVWLSFEKRVQSSQ